MDIALDADGDIDLSAGDARLCTDLEAIAQHLKVRLRFIKGEWHLNTDEGLPYFEEIFVVGADIRLVEAIIRRVVLGTPGVTSITTMMLEPDYAARTLGIVLDAQTVLGTLSSEDFGPFVVSA